MKKNAISILAAFLTILFITGCAEGEAQEEEFQESAETEANIVFAEEFIMFTSEGNYDTATEYLDETMSEELPPEELEDIWTSLEDQLGSFVSQEYDSSQEAEDYDIILMNGHFEEGDVVFQIALNQDEEIAGFYVLDSKDKN